VTVNFNILTPNVQVKRTYSLYKKSNYGRCLKSMCLLLRLFYAKTRKIDVFE